MKKSKITLAELIKECKYLLNDANPNGNSYTNHKDEWKGMFTVHGHILEEIYWMITEETEKAYKGI